MGRIARLLLPIGACLMGTGSAGAQQPDELLTLTSDDDQEANATTDDARDALQVLLRAEGELSAEEADALLRDAFDAWPTSTSRARAFGAAAAAAGERAPGIAFAWIDWGLDEARAAGATGADIAVDLSEQGIMLAIRHDNPSLARRYAREQGELALDWSYDSEALSAVFSDLDAQCPDVIAHAWIRTRIARDAISATSASRYGAARCQYRHIRSASDYLMDFNASASWIDPRTRLEGVVEAGLDPAERVERETLAAQMPMQIHETRRDAIESGPAHVALVRQYSRTQNRAMTFAYALSGGEGTLYSVRVRAEAEWAWPPEDMASLALEALATLTGDGSG